MRNHDTAPEGSPASPWDNILNEHGDGWRIALTAEEADLVRRGLLTREDWKARRAHYRNAFGSLDDEK